MVITTTKTSSTSNSNMKSATNLNASAGTSARTPGSSSKSSVRAIIGKGKPSVNVASPPPTSVSQVNQKMKPSATASTTDVKSASTSSSKTKQKIAKQIEYYFSPESLQENNILRQHMDEQGWVPVSLIAGFHKVMLLVEGIPNCIQFILRAVRGSTIVETRGDMIRKRNGQMNNHLQSSNVEGTSEVTANNQMKDRLRGFSAWDKVEVIRESFYRFTRALPIKMEVHDKIIVVDAMKGLLDDLQHKYDHFKQKLGVAAESYSEKIIEFVEKHPYVVDRTAFQELLSDEQKIRFKLHDTAIAENKSKMQNSQVYDEQLIKVLHQELQQVEDEYKLLISKVLEYDQMIRFVDSFISVVRTKDTV